MGFILQVRMYTFQNKNVNNANKNGNVAFILPNIYKTFLVHVLRFYGDK